VSGSPVPDEREAPLASVLVPVLNEERDLPDSLDGMLAQRLEGGIELLFIDGGSEDRTREILRDLAARDGRVRLLENPARRTPNALNVGLREARGEFVVRMDAHTRYPADYVANGVERLRRGDVDWVAGPQLAAGSGTWSRRVALALASPLGTGGARFRRTARAEEETDSGFTGVWRRSTLESHGGWDEGWPINQDAELAARVRKAGGRIVCLPEMAARYTPRDSLRALGRQYWRYGVYRVKTARRHPESLRRSNLLPPALVLTLLFAVAAPAPLRGSMRRLIGLYACAVAAASANAARGASAADALVLPAVFGTMHLGWGMGFLWGCARFGVPAPALLRTLGPLRLPARGRH
jgi:succinoglycan biosynthesis protein ExoA